MGQGPLSEDEAELLRLETETYQEECNRTFQAAAPGLARELIKLAMYGSNERIKFQAITHCLDRALGRVQDVTPNKIDDPHKELMDGLEQLLKEASNGTPSSASYLPDNATPPTAVGFESGEGADFRHRGLMRDIYNDLPGGNDAEK